MVSGMRFAATLTALAVGIALRMSWANGVIQLPFTRDLNEAASCSKADCN